MPDSEPRSDRIDTGCRLRLGSVELRSRFLLSPLAGYTNLALRLALRELGGMGLATTDLVNARSLLMASRRTFELIETCAEDQPLAVQIYGADSGEMGSAAQWLEARGYGLIDINMGCPVRKVTRHGGGSALMCDAETTVSLVRKVVDAVRIPVTVKMRLGWDDASWSAPYFARAFEQAGVAGVIIHGRTREQGFRGKVNLDGIRAVVEAVDQIPVIGNGDVRTIAGAEKMLEMGCAGVAIGRGALLNPWIFAQLVRWHQTGDPGESIGYEQRLAFMNRHFHSLVNLRGSHLGCLMFRKVANWYCRVLRTGHEIQQQLTRIDDVAVFDQIVQSLHDWGPPRGWQAPDVGAAAIAVPQGPIERW